MLSQPKISTISAETLAALLPSKTLNRSLFVFEELPSTNTFALELAKRSAHSGTIILADQQTAGRGRLQRSWFSPPGTNIYGSLIFLTDRSIQERGWIPLMAGLAIAEGIERQTAIPITLKWPNDVLVNESKVGGILCESFFKRETSYTYVIIGFGINVNLPQSAIPKDLLLKATSLHLHTRETLDRHLLIQSMATTLEQAWDRFSSEGPTACKRSYNSRCSTLGQTVQVQFSDGHRLAGIAQSIGQDGQLQVRPSMPQDTAKLDGLIDVHAGDIFHLRTHQNEPTQKFK